MSFTLGGTLLQRCSLYSITQADEFGNGKKRVPIRENVACRFVLSEQREFNASAGGYVRLGAAAAWLDGDMPVEVGDVFLDLDSKREFRIESVSKPRDLFTPRVDHTKLILE